MRLSLIGMSGTGKSYWSRKLAERGFKRFSCDELISEKLAAALTGPNGTVRAMGEWMGFPFEPNYCDREAMYLRYELEVLDEILTYLETDPAAPENIIVDTTGSVIYTGQIMLERLLRQTKVIYLDTPLQVQEKMREAYLSNPAPVLWRDIYKPEPGETDQQALARCYPKLLASRTNKYKKWAEVTLDYYQVRQPDFTVADFLKEIGAS
jgi:shikimate kinase